ncbi:MAG TPA: M48 family metallopeptidase [Solirubrobacteraceae bacterium]|nr:M48 family metallopeptidase [Solirubrobacteraceae bacterium]
MRHRSRYGSVAATLLALGAAELGGRLLRPRQGAAKSVEADVRTHFSDAEIERGARYARPQVALGLARSALGLGAMAATVDRIPRVLPARLRSSLLGGAVAGAGFSLGTWLPPLPLSIVARRRSIAVGLITQSWRGWAVDQVKSQTIAATISAGAGAATVAVTRRYPTGWWLPAAAGSVVVGSVFAALAPVVLDPVFNDFTPLPEGDTRTDVLDLAYAAGVRVGEIYSIDASRRTTAANAYVTGLGPTKRVVLFDTLLDRYSRDEIRVVVAHELAHVRNRDVRRGVAYTAVVAPAAALAVQRLSWTLSDERGTATAVPAIGLAAALISAPIGIIANRLSRAIERRADRFSLQLSQAPEAFISFERAIAVQNVADVNPPRWVTALLASHPPTAERIGAAVTFAQASSQEPPGT